MFVVMRRFLAAGSLFLILLAGVTARAHAQGKWRAASGATYVLPVEAGNKGDCGDAYRVGVLQRVGRQVAGAHLAVEANLRAHLIATANDSCVYGPVQFPPPDGTYIVEDRAAPYLTTRFLAGDLRLRATLPTPSTTPMFSLGYGRHWQHRGFYTGSGTRPYLVAGVGMLVGTGPRWRLAIEGEYQALRESFDRRRVTWLGGQMTGNEELGTDREWQRAVGITVSAVVSF